MCINSIATRCLTKDTHAYIHITDFRAVVTKYRHNNKVVSVYVMNVYGAVEL